MITSGSKQRRAEVLSASIDFGSASVEQAADSVADLAPGTFSQTVGLDRGRTHSTLERLRERRRDRTDRVVAEALASERRRVAAYVHDLIMQDLALALATSRALADDPAIASQASVIVAAGERALAGARDLMAGLIDRSREPVVEAVEACVRTAAGCVPVSFDAGAVPAGAQPDQSTLYALVHIGREAVTNAIKHADPSAVEVVLEREDEWRLRVSDDGRGFDAQRAGGFGLESMRGHAHALGGSLRVLSAPEAGTVVEAVLP